MPSKPITKSEENTISVKDFININVKDALLYRAQVTMDQKQAESMAEYETKLILSMIKDTAKDVKLNKIQAVALSDYLSGAITFAKEPTHFGEQIFKRNIEKIITAATYINSLA
jgi:hypothetical protein